MSKIQKIRKLFNCNRNQAEKIEKLIKEIAIKGVYEDQERIAIIEDDNFDVPF